MKEAPRPQPTLKDRLISPFAKGGVVRIALAPLLATGGISGGILNSACAPAAPSLEYQSNIPIVGDPSKAAEHGDTIVASPTPDQRLGLATGSTTSGSEQTASRDGGTTGKPAEISTRPETLPVSDIPAQLDSILASVDAKSQSLNQNVTKRDLEIPAQEVKAALAKGDIEGARKNLREFKAAVQHLGDPLKNRFIPKEIRDNYDPQGLVMKNTDIVDPAVLDLYLSVVQMELSLLRK